MHAGRTWLRALLPTIAAAQRFPNGFAYDSDISTLTPACQSALNRTVDCSWLLTLYQVDSVDLSTQNLTTICTDDCYSSLTATRDVIKSACPTSSNHIYGDGASSPATQRIDSLIDTYNKTCLRDTQTDRFCYDVMRPWQNETVFTTQQNCSYCLLATLQLDQSSEYSYSGEFAAEFSSLTSSCGSTGFQPATPVSTALNASSTASSTATPTAPSCASTYTIQPDDTCNGICKAQDVSTDALVSNNRLGAYCQDLPAAGTELCMPQRCDIYTVKKNDTCQSIAASQPGYVTVTQLQAWNPNLNVLCTNMAQQEDMQICVSPPGEHLGVLTSTPPSPPVATTPAPQPSNMANGTNTRCAEYYKVQQGDTCSKITINASPSISLDDFLFLNPSVDGNCSNLIPDESYCIQAVGDISTYSGYGSDITGSCTGPGSPSTCYGDWATLSPVPFGDLASSTRTVSPSTTPSASSSTKPISIPEYTPQPTALGTWSTAECERYAEYVDTGDEDTNALANSCSYMAEFYSISVDDLEKWNPSLQETNPCAFAKGRRYCVVAKMNETSTSGSSASAPSTTTTATATTSNDPTTTTGITTPTPTQSGMVSDCDKFYKVEKGDGCYAIATSHGITPDQFVEYNPAVKKDCSGLWPDYFVCIGVAER